MMILGNIAMIRTPKLTEFVVDKCLYVHVHIWQRVINCVEEKEGKIFARDALVFPSWFFPLLRKEER